MADQTPAERSKSEAKYWLNQVKMAEEANNYRRWLDVGQKYYDRYLLQSKNMEMAEGTEGAAGITGRNVYNLLWTNVQTVKPMLYSKLPEPYVTRKFGNRAPVARMASTIGERATSTDLDRDDFDDVADQVVDDYLIVGRGTLRCIYEMSIVNSRIPVREENREDGEPVFITEDGQTIPGSAIDKDERGLFTLDPNIVDERAPLMYHHWRDFLIGPGRNWAEVKKRGWIDWICYLTKADAANRFGQDAADKLSYTYSPYDLQRDQNTSQSAVDSNSTYKLARIDEIWDAREKSVIWVSKGYDDLLDKQPDKLDLVGFFNTPRPLNATTGPNSLIPVPDYAEYRTQAKELDQITGKIEEITEEIRAGGVYDESVPNLGTALKSKAQGWHGVDNWAAFANSGGMTGAVQGYDNQSMIGTVAALYEHRAQTKLDADEIAGMPDIFRAQQSQRDERLGQTKIRKSLGGLRINDKERDFQRYLRDALAIKAEIIVSHFEPRRLLEMADAPSLIEESPEVARLTIMAESEQGKQALQNPQAMAQFQIMRQAAVTKQMTLIMAALQLLKSDRMRTFSLNIETDETAAVDDAEAKVETRDFVETVGTLLERVFNSEAIAQNPELKAITGEMLMLVVRRFKVGRSMEQKLEEVIENMITAPPAPQQPDPLTLDVQRQAQADQMDFQTDQQKNAIDAFNAATKRQEVEVKAVDAARDADREDLETAAKIIQGAGTVGNA